LKRLDLDEKISKDGRAESGVWRSVRVVKDMLCRSDGSGPVTVGYIPVQYDTVVEILGDGKTKLISTSPYDITFVIARALNRDVALRTGGADDVASGEVVVVNVNVEVRVLCETKTELNSELDAVLVVGTLMLLAEDMELPASELELVIKELESTEELVMVLELNSVEELDVKLKLRLEDEFVIGNSVAKPVEVFGPGILVTGSFGRLDDGVELDVKLGVDDVGKLDNVVGAEIEIPVEDVKEGDEVGPVDGTTEELPEPMERVDGAKLLGERGFDVDSDRVRPVDDGIAGLPILLVRLVKVLDDMSAERVGPEVRLGRDTVKPSLCVDGKTKEPPVVVDVPGLRVGELPDRLVNVVGALGVVGTLEPVGSAEDVPRGVLEIMLEPTLGRLLDETTDEMIELMVFEDAETKGGKRTVESVETEVDSPLLIVTTLVEAGNDGYGLCG